MPAVTTRFDSTKHDMRKGRKTGFPVSAFTGKRGHKDSKRAVLSPSFSLTPFSLSLSLSLSNQAGDHGMLCTVPGCKVESTSFLARHSSGVIEGISPALYCASSDVASSRVARRTKRVLMYF